jgi:hypothetical protein
VNQNPLLTKSRFKVGCECATKLYYLDNRDYGNTKADDPFLRALAEGGFQVGELAKIYHPDGIEIRERDYDSSVAATNELLNLDSSTIFEAAIRHENLFVRVDVVTKKGQKLELIEVKAKSFDPTDEEDFFTKKGTIRSEWESYLLDIAFQAYVARKAFPSMEIKCFLMMADKSAVASVDGINQRFLISRDKTGRPQVKVRAGTNAEQLGKKILCKISVDEAVDYIINSMYESPAGWQKHVHSLANLVTTKAKATPKLSSECKSCEFRIKQTDQSSKKSGFTECWQSTGLSKEELARPMVFDIWNFRKSQALIESRRYFIHQLNKNDISPKEDNEPGLTSSQRQWIQVEKSIKKDSSAYVDLAGLSAEFKQFTYPLHFIDFETSMSALPFNKGRRPYEQIAFQFSHHTVYSDGSIKHTGQFIHSKRGEFPNFTFVRELKKSLEGDQGSIFRYSNHENTVLRQIHAQILSARETLPDAEELLTWIDSVTTSTEEKVRRVGGRSMIDLCEMVKKYYYSPHTNGSNSIKKVLPAVFKDSDFLRAKYQTPIYGSDKGPSSLNFRDWTWLTLDGDGQIVDPYKRLPPIFSEEELEQIEPMVNASEIADGGAAMMAYALMQFTEMSEEEAQKIQHALLKYCELDTFAMVMIFEHWNDLIGKAKAVSAA